MKVGRIETVIFLFLIFYETGENSTVFFLRFWLVRASFLVVRFKVT